jgi:hypothetical protein
MVTEKASEPHAVRSTHNSEPSEARGRILVVFVVLVGIATNLCFQRAGLSGRPSMVGAVVLSAVREQHDGCVSAHLEDAI